MLQNEHGEITVIGGITVGTVCLLVLIGLVILKM